MPTQLRAAWDAKPSARAAVCSTTSRIAGLWRRDEQRTTRSTRVPQNVPDHCRRRVDRARISAAADAPPPQTARTPRVKFAAIGLNHGHINGQIDAVIGGGGELVSFFAKEPDLAEPFAKRYPNAKLARSEKEILEDSSIQLVVSASIPNERGPLGVEVMKHGKDFMVDKPGMTTLEQLAELKKTQAETKRIYSVCTASTTRTRPPSRPGSSSRRARSAG